MSDEPQLNYSFKYLKNTNKLGDEKLLWSKAWQIKEAKNSRRNMKKRNRREKTKSQIE